MTSDNRIVTPAGFTVPERALTWRFDRAGGPGGQHRNKTSTRAHLEIDLSLLEGDDDELERVRRRLGPTLVLAEGSARSQWRNRSVLLERAAATIDEAARVKAPRKKSRPTATARERRLQEKHRQSERKKNRRPVRPD